MSRSPERISSYRRHFEEGISSSYQVRVSSPSPVRREARPVSAAGYPCRPGAGIVRVESAGRTMSAARRSRMVGAGVGVGALVCVGPTGEPPMDLDVAAAENQEFKNTRTSERQEMIVLNDRLAVYIDKVRSLEQQNKLLEAEIEAYQNRFVKPSGLRQLYEEQLRELKKIADQMKAQRDIAFAAKDSTAAQLAGMKLKYEEAIELRRKAEAEIETFRPDVDQATSSRIALEKRLEQLEVEIEFLKRVHQQEIDELMKQIYVAHATAQSAFALPDLAAALKQIQNQYDDIAAKNLQEMDSWYKSKFEDLTKKTSRHVDNVRSFREGVANAKKDIQGKERDMEALKTRNEALEAKIREMQEKYRKELEDLQARIESLQLELKTTKEKIALHLREYQDLLNMKMALEIEITTYRKLIEGEDLRLSGMMQTLSLTSCSMSAIGTGMSFGEGGIGGVGGTSKGEMSGFSSSSGGVGAGIGVGVGAGSGGIERGIGADMGVAGRGGARDMAGGIGGASSRDTGFGRGSGVAGFEGFGGTDDGVTDASAISGRVGDRAGTSVGTGAAGIGARSGVVGSDHGEMGASLGGFGAGHGGVDTGLGTTEAMEGRGIGSGGAFTSAGFGPAETGTSLGGLGAGLAGVDTGLGRASGASLEGTGPGGAYTGVGVGPSEIGTGLGGLEARHGGVDTSLGAAGASLEDKGIGLGGAYIGVGGAGAGFTGIGARSVDASVGLGVAGTTLSGDAGLGGLGTGSERVGTGFEVGEGTQPEETAPGYAGLGLGDRTSFKANRVGGTGVGDPTSHGGVGGTGVGFSDSKSGLEVSGTAAGQGIGDERGLVSGKAGVDSEVKGFAGPGRTPAAEVGEKEGSGSGVGFGADPCSGNIEPYAEQAVELTERRTVIIRTVKHDNEVLEMDHREQTYTISGAADDSDND